MSINFQVSNSGKSLEMVSTQEQIDKYIEEISRAGHPEKDNRHDPRYSVSCPITLQPVDEFLHPVSEYFETICCNISKNGISFMNNGKFDSELLFVEMPELVSSDRICVLVKVKHTTLILDNLYNIGCQFVVGEDH